MLMFHFFFMIVASDRQPLLHTFEDIHGSVDNFFLSRTSTVDRGPGWDNNRIDHAISYASKYKLSKDLYSQFLQILGKEPVPLAPVDCIKESEQGYRSVLKLCLFSTAAFSAMNLGFTAKGISDLQNNVTLPCHWGDPAAPTRGECWWMHPAAIASIIALVSRFVTMAVLSNRATQKISYLSDNAKSFWDSCKTNRVDPSLQAERNHAMYDEHFEHLAIVLKEIECDPTGFRDLFFRHPKDWFTKSFPLRGFLTLITVLDIPFATLAQNPPPLQYLCCIAALSSLAVVLATSEYVRILLLSPVGVKPPTEAEHV